MKMKLFIRMAFFFIIIALAGCSKSDMLNEGTEEGAVSPDKAKICFRLDGVATRAAELGEETDLSTDEEKALKSVHVAIFNGKANDAGEGTLYQIAELDLTQTTENTDNTFELELGKAGVFNLCFIANADESVKTALGKLTAERNLVEADSPVENLSTISDLNKITINQAPETKENGMIMTSDYVTGISARFGSMTDIGVVGLDRAMARFDIVNNYEGVTITKVVFKNLTDKSSLNTISNSLNEEFLRTTDIVKDGLNLAGSVSVPAELKAEIYSYEQLAEAEHAKRPKLEIYYSQNDTPAEKPLIVDFVLNKNNYQEALRIKRNHLYRIQIKRLQQIDFTITVQDWQTGETLLVSNEDIGEGDKPDYSEMKIGDYLTKDGGIISYSSGLTLSEEQKKNIIGVVFSTYFPPIEEQYPNKQDLYMMRDYPECRHGWAVALKDLSTGDVCWSENDTYLYDWVKNNIIPDLDKYWSYLQYQNYTSLLLYNEFNKKNNNPQYQVLPVKLVMEYRQLHKEAPGTGWILPPAHNEFYSASPVTTVNQSLTKLGADYAINISNYYWTAVEYNTNSVYYTTFNTTSYYNKTYKLNYKVRPVIAF